MGPDQAIAFLRSYGIVRGDENGDLRLNDTVTRAEAATIFVRAVGKDSLADLLKDSVPFADTKGHWAAGYVTLAYRQGLMKGRNDTTFDPNARITNAEVLTILLRIVEREPNGAWNPSAIMQAAAQLGIFTEGPADLLASQPAFRGSIFRALANALTTVQLSSGGTAAQKYLDNVAPVLDVAAVPATTSSETVAVSGTVTGADTVTVNGQAVTVLGNTFSTSVSLVVGANSISVVAADLAGNATTKTVTVSRGGNVASIDVVGSVQVALGQTAQVRAVPKDAAGLALPVSLLNATVSGVTGTVSVAAGTFTAGNVAGNGTIVFSAGSVTKEVSVAIVDPASAAKAVSIVGIPAGGIPTGKTATITVNVVDENNSVVTVDQGRAVKLEATGLAGVAVSPSVATTVAGVATFTVLGSTAGDLKFTASSTGLTSDSEPASFTTAVHIVLTPTAAASTADGFTPVAIRASLQDESGKEIINSSGEDIYVDIATDSDTTSASNPSITIRRNMSNSAGNDGRIVPGVVTETVKVTGTVRSSQNYSVVPATVRFTEVAIGSASTFDFVGGSGNYDPAISQDASVTLHVTDTQGNMITKGSFAFQVQVTTSNNEALVDGLPEGVTVTLGSSGLAPVAGVKDAVVARTDEGSAVLHVTYNKSGRVYLKAVGVASTSEAYADTGDLASATSGVSLKSVERYVQYVGVATTSQLRVDLPGSKLSDQSFGVLPANGSAIAKVKVYVADAAGGRLINAGGIATLTHKTGTGTRTSTTTPVTLTNGVAEFTIIANGSTQADVDTWEASVTGVAGKGTITIATYKEKPDVPTINTITGEGGDLNRVSISDTYMDIQLANYPVGNYGFVKVYRSGTSTLLYTSNVMDLHDGPYVQVPKKSLPNASDRYYVVVNNGYGETRSDLWPTDPTDKVINEIAATADITRARYNADTEQLIVTASGVYRDGTIDPSRLILRNTVQGGTVLPLSGATCTAASGSFTCTLTGLNITAEEFNGAVLLDTEDGWYYRDSSGQSAARDADVEDNYVYPMAFIDHAALSFGTDRGHVTATITLYGKNLNQGRIYLNELTINGDANLALGKSTQSVAPTSSSVVSINLPNFYNLPSGGVEADSVAYKVSQMAGPSVTLDAASGWLKDTYSDFNGEILNIPVFAVMTVSSVRYDGVDTLTITGPNFDGATTSTVFPDNLVIKNRSGGIVVDMTAADTVTEVTSTSIKIKLDPAHAALLVGKSGSVYLSSEETTGTVHWIANGSGWYGTTMNSFRLVWQ